MVSQVTTYHDLKLGPTDAYGAEVSPTIVSDPRSAGPAHGFVADKLDSETWSLRFPQGVRPMTVYAVHEAWQQTGKGTLPLTWTTPEGVVEVVTFDMVALDFAPVSANKYELGDIVLRRWHG